MRKLLFISFISIIFCSCSKDDPAVLPQNVTPYILAQADQWRETSPNTKTVINDGSIKILYGTKLLYKNKAFTYKFELFQVSKFAFMGGKEYVIPIDNDDIIYNEVSDGSVAESQSNGGPIEYTYNVPSSLGTGGYQAKITTVCDGDIETASFYINIEDKL